VATDPGVSSGGSVVVSSSTTLKARAFRDGLLPSLVTSVSYNLKVARPAFDPPIGPVTNGQSIAILCLTPGATIRYTLDGTDPTASSPLYQSPIAYSNSAMLKARAFKSGFADSVAAVFSPSLFSIQNFMSVGNGLNNSLDCPSLAGWSYQLQTAEDPAHWRNLGGAQPGTNGTLRFYLNNVYPLPARHLFRITAVEDLGF